MVQIAFIIVSGYVYEKLVHFAGVIDHVVMLGELKSELFVEFGVSFGN